MNARGKPPKKHPLRGPRAEGPTDPRAEGPIEGSPGAGNQKKGMEMMRRLLCSGARARRLLGVGAPPSPCFLGMATSRELHPGFSALGPLSRRAATQSGSHIYG